MKREMLERMTKKELIELVERQERAIDRLDMQRQNSNVIIDQLASAIGNLNLLRNHDLERGYYQDNLNDYVYQMYQKYPICLVKTEAAVYNPQEEKNNEDVHNLENIT